MTAMGRVHRDTDGATTVEFALLLPLVLAVVGMGLMLGWSFVNLALLDRAAEVAARETVVADRDAGVAAAIDRTPLVALEPGSFTLTDAAGVPLTADPAPGQAFTVTVSHEVSIPGFALLRMLPAARGEDGRVTLRAVAQGVGQ